MTDTDKAHLLEDFKEMTGTTDEFAISFLESSDWNLDQAMELFLGGQGGVARVSSKESSSSVDSALASFGGGGGTDNAEDIMRIMEQHGVDYDTAVAIKEAGGGGAQQTSTGAVGADGVRAPILQKRARLFDTMDQDDDNGSFGGGGFGMPGGFPMHPGAIDAQLRIAREAIMRGSGGSVSSAAVPEARPSQFAPPRWMMFLGTFEEARNQAKAMKRWLIVNIQDPTEFQSLVLNRDLWSDETTQSFIRDSFLFWQQDRNSADAQRFITLYNPTPPFPYVCIIDPRTGERARVLKLKKKEDELRDSFFDQVVDFFDTSSLDTKRKAAPVGSSASSSLSKSESATTSMADPDERELAAAIEASLQVSEKSMIGKECVQNKAEASPSKPTSKIPMPPFPVLGAEPPASPETTIIQLRFSDGSKLKRRFLKSSPVGILFAFAASSNKVPSGARFDLLTNDVPGVSLLAKFAQSIAEADASNQSLLVRLLDG